MIRQCRCHCHSTQCYTNEPDPARAAKDEQPYRDVDEHQDEINNKRGSLTALEAEESQDRPHAGQNDKARATNENPPGEGTDFGLIGSGDRSHLHSLSQHRFACDFRRARSSQGRSQVSELYRK